MHANSRKNRQIHLNATNLGSHPAASYIVDREALACTYVYIYIYIFELKTLKTNLAQVVDALISRHASIKSLAAVYIAVAARLVHLPARWLRKPRNKG